MTDITTILTDSSNIVTHVSIIVYEGHLTIFTDEGHRIACPYDTQSSVFPILLGGLSILDAVDISNESGRDLHMTSKHLSDLPSLTGLDISNVTIKNASIIPPTVEEMSLRNMSIDGLDGIQLKNLRTIYITECRSDLDRPIDLNGCTSLESFNIDGGNIHYLPKIGGCTSLVSMSVGNTDLSLDSMCQWDLSRLINLQTLSIYACNLEGNISDIDAWLGSLSRLDHLEICNNPLLTGDIPSSIRQLTHISTINLRNNSITGGLEHVQNLSRLSVFNLSNNSLVGDIPSTLFTTNTRIHAYSLYNNRLTSLPPIVLSRHVTVRTSDDLSFNPKHWNRSTTDTSYSNIVVHT